MDNTVTHKQIFLIHWLLFCDYILKTGIQYAQMHVLPVSKR